MGRLCTRRKYLKIKRDAHELPCGILTLLLGKFRNAESIKKENRGEGEFKAFNKIISPTPFTGKDFNLTILSNLSFKIF
jgi:hypothetical protein